jgi:hypothetical protein
MVFFTRPLSPSAMGLGSFISTNPERAARKGQALAVRYGARFGLFEGNRQIDVFYPTISCHFCPFFVGNLAKRGVSALLN